MIEPEAVIDPEAAPPAPRRQRGAIVAGVTVLALVAGGFAVAVGEDPAAKPLALMAGSGAAGRAETMSADAGASAPVAPVLGSAAARSSIPYGWGFEFEVVGQLPALPDHATAWDVNTPDLDRAAFGRIAGALGVTGTPVQRDGGWFIEGGDWTLSAFGGDAFGKGGAWSINLYRSRYDGRLAGPAGTDAAGGPVISRAEAEQRVRDLLARMAAPRASWKVDVTETEIGVGSACAAPGFSPEELRKIEAGKLSQIERENAASDGGATTGVDPAPPAGSGAGSSGAAGATPPGKPAPDTGPALCPPPPPPVKGFNVALYPLLDGRRADWPVWNVTMRSDGRLENLYGSWVNFERGGEYRLRGVDAALKDLQSPGVPYATDPPAAIEPAIDLPADTARTQPANPAGATTPANAGAATPANAGAATPATAGAATPAAGPAPGSSASGRRPLRGDVASAPAVDLPAGAPVCPMPMPMPVEDARATSTAAAGCVPPAPPVVKITGVELGLIQTSVFEDGQVRMALVPSYRFTGRFDNGGPWETSVLALHSSAIAPPPDTPASSGMGGGGTTGSAGAGAGKSLPPIPVAEPAAARDAN